MKFLGFLALGEIAEILPTVRDICFSGLLRKTPKWRGINKNAILYRESGLKWRNWKLFLAEPFRTLKVIRKYYFQMEINNPRVDSEKALIRWKGGHSECWKIREHNSTMNIYQLLYSLVDLAMHGRSIYNDLLDPLWSQNFMISSCPHQLKNDFQGRFKRMKLQLIRKFKAKQFWIYLDLENVKIVVFVVYIIETTCEDFIYLTWRYCDVIITLSL